MVKSLPKVLYYGAKIMVASLLKSIQEEIALSRQLAKIRYQDTNTSGKHIVDKSKNCMTLDEAQKILNVNILDPKEVQERFNYLFTANKRFFYLQSKVFRAKEVINFEVLKAKDKFSEKKKNLKSMSSNGKYLFVTYILMNERQ